MSQRPLSILDVIDRGKPNLERIPLKVEHQWYMHDLWLGIGIKSSDDILTPLNDNILWLGRGWVYPNDWIFVYTGTGTANAQPIPGQNGKIYTVHWNKPNLLFSSPEIHPFLLHGMMELPPSASFETSYEKLLSAS